MRQKSFDLGAAHLVWMALAVKEDVAADPVELALLGADGVVFEANDAARLIQERAIFWSVGNGF
jgi:hypothetical protein